jgi:hypothetical protein
LHGEIYPNTSGLEPGKREQHFCKECLDTYFACTPWMNPLRGLICLSDDYRQKLYELLWPKHPEAWDNRDVEACRRGSKIMEAFLREHLKKEKIEVNDDAFGMLFGSFLDSNQMEDFRKRKGLRS